MKRFKPISLIIKVFGFTFIIFLLFLIINYYISVRSIYSYDSFILNFSRMLVLIAFNVIFFILFFILDLEIYKYLFIYLVLYGIFLWILQYLSLIFGNTDLSFNLDIFFSVMLFMTYNIVAPGLILYTISYIRKISSKNEGNLLGKYHIHESFFGFILIGIALILFFIRIILIQYRIFWQELRIILAIFNVSIFIFLFFGSFFFFRDIRDVIKFKFIEILKSDKDKEQNVRNTSVFQNIQQSSLSFYKKLKIPIYPLGILLTNFAFNMVIYGSDFLIPDIFQLEYNLVVMFGYLLVFGSAGLIGFDWVHIFKKFYPDKYYELKSELIKLKNNRR